uniref:Ribonucleotide reductase subunit 1 n=1 Tax=Hipposideros bat herpesvirus TaxID=3141919 RepID=A0AAU7E1S1_9VIRU
MSGGFNSGAYDPYESFTVIYDSDDEDLSRRGRVYADMINCRDVQIGNGNVKVVSVISHDPLDARSGDSDSFIVLETSSGGGSQRASAGRVVRESSPGDSSASCIKDVPRPDAFARKQVQCHAPADRTRRWAPVQVTTPEDRGRSRIHSSVWVAAAARADVVRNVHPSHNRDRDRGRDREVSRVTESMEAVSVRPACSSGPVCVERPKTPYQKPKDERVQEIASNVLEQSFPYHVDLGVCICHREPSRLRCCVKVRRIREMVMTSELINELEKAAEDLSTYGIDRYVETILSVAPLAVAMDPCVDIPLGRLYTVSNRRQECHPTKLYTGPYALEGLAFSLKRNKKEVESCIDMMQSWFGNILPRGIMSAVMYLDAVGNWMGEHRESIPGINIRVAGTVSWMLTDCMRGNAYMKVLARDGFSDMFHYALSVMSSTDMCFSFRLMSKLGLVKKTCLCDSVLVHVDDLRAETLLSVNASSICRYMADGVPISVNVTRIAANPMHAAALLSYQCEAVRATQKLKTSVNIYFDLWNVYSVKMFDKILSMRTGARLGTTYTVMVPSLFFHKLNRSTSCWTFFSREECDNLDGLCGSEFDRAYDRMEAKKMGLKVSIKWVARKLSNAVQTGRLAVVFPDNVTKNSILKYPTAPTSLGVDCASQSYVDECSTVTYSAYLNLVEFVDQVVPDSVKHDHNMFISDGGGYFNLRRMRESVRYLVCALDAVIDEDAPNHDAATQRAVGRFRTIKLGVVGFHAVLARMKLAYGGQECVEFNSVVFESLCYAALRTSVDLCVAGLPKCTGFYDTCYADGVLPIDKVKSVNMSLPGEYWASLREDVVEHGLRNAAMISLGPCGEVSHMLGVSESFYPSESPVSVRDCVYQMPLMTDAASDPGRNMDAACGELLDDKPMLKLPVVMCGITSLKKEQLRMVLDDRHRHYDPEADLYMSAYLIDMDSVLEMCRDRAPFVDQGQAPVLFVNEGPFTDTIDRLRLAHDMGLQCGVYKCSVRASTV